MQTISRLASAGQPPRTADLANATALRDGAAPSSRLAGFFLSSLLILGLLGTLAAFRGVLGEPPCGVAEGRIDAAKLDSYVRDVYRGLGGAFYASMAGVGGTVLLLISRAVFVTGARNACLSELDVFTEEDLIPRLFHAPPPAPRALNEASIRMRSVTEDLGKLGDRVREALIGAQASATNLQRFSEDLRNGAGTLAATFAAGGPVEQQFSSLASSLQRQETILEEATAEAGADRATLREALGKLSQLGEAVVLWQHAAGGLLDKFSKSQDAQINATKATAEAVATGVSELVKLTATLQERQQQAHRDHVVSLGKLEEAFRAGATRLAEQALELDGRRQQSHLDLVQKLSSEFDRMDAVARKFAEMTTAWQSSSDEHAAMIEAFGSQITDTNREHTASIRAALEALRHLPHPTGNHSTPSAVDATPPTSSPPKPSEGLRRWFGGT